MNESAVTLRPATPEDVQFACQVSRETMRGHAIATFGTWSEEEARQRCSRNSAAGFTRIIELGEVPIGIYVVDRAPDHVQLLQIFILPNYQRRGIGSRLIEGLLAEARAAHVPLRLRVLRVNPAFELYQRMGFRVVEETAERYCMEHSP
jgi:ribosomal protein S18 acetylase RimI-like enzyme